MARSPSTFERGQACSEQHGSSALWQISLTYVAVKLRLSGIVTACRFACRLKPGAMPLSNSSTSQPQWMGAASAAALDTFAAHNRRLSDLRGHGNLPSKASVRRPGILSMEDRVLQPLQPDMRLKRDTGRLAETGSPLKVTTSLRQAQTRCLALRHLRNLNSAPKPEVPIASKDARALNRGSLWHCMACLWPESSCRHSLLFGVS